MAGEIAAMAPGTLTAVGDFESLASAAEHYVKEARRSRGTRCRDRPSPTSCICDSPFRVA
jgi:hypothetical protein